MDTRETPERSDGLTAPQPAPSVGAWLWQQAPVLAILGAVVAVLWKYDVDFLNVGKVVVGLGLVIFIHELGHFLAAKWCDVHVETFSIGFGPPLPGCHFRYGETTYMVALIPLGGYVKMVGEGSDGEEGEDDPRSFKNKTVGQRMLIISAGVIMNVLLAAVCFASVYMTSGVERPAGVIGTVESGSPAWQKGLHSGVLLTKLGDADRPFFDDVMPEVMHWKIGQPLPVTFEENHPVPRTVRVDVIPRKNETSGRPMIGIAPSQKAVLAPRTRKGSPPVVPGSAASRATPEFRSSDRVVGASADPERPESATPLPPDPRNTGGNVADYFEFLRREQLMAGKPMTVLVRRAGESDTSEPVAVTVPPAFHVRLGAVMSIGTITAVRDNSPAARAGVRPRTDMEPGDVLAEVEVARKDGSRVRFLPTPPAASEAGVSVVRLDPVRLPFDLNHHVPVGEAKEVTLTILRQQGHLDRAPVKVKVEWDEQWRFAQSAPINPSSPVALDTLGLAYAVSTHVEEVDSNSPAAAAGLRKGDTVSAIMLYDTGADGNPAPSRWTTLRADQWPQAHYVIQRSDSRKVGLSVEREGKTVEIVLTPETDTTWPASDRGVVFASDLRLQKAESVVEALGMGVTWTHRWIRQIYQNLLAMIDGRISFPKNASGPLTIGAVAYAIAGESLEQLVLFLGMISINLAVINFLPIPVLDGGHMVFLVYEKLRGRPAPEQLRYAATFVGLALIGSLMLFVIYLDVKRLLF